MPKGWVYLGRDDSGVEYWRAGSDVMSVTGISSRWLCTMAAWPLYCKIHTVAVPTLVTI